MIVLVVFKIQVFGIFGPWTKLSIVNDKYSVLEVTSYTKFGVRTLTSFFYNSTTAGGCMRNANKCRKMSYSAMAREEDPESLSQTGSVPNLIARTEERTGRKIKAYISKRHSVNLKIHINLKSHKFKFIKKLLYRTRSRMPPPDLQIYLCIVWLWNLTSSIPVIATQYIIDIYLNMCLPCFVKLSMIVKYRQKGFFLWRKLASCDCVMWPPDPHSWSF